MPAFWIGAAWFLGVIATKLVYRIAAGLGVGLATYTGINWILDQLEAAVQGSFGGMSQIMLDAITLLQIDQAMSVILSAYAVVAFLAGAKVLLKKLD